MKFDKVECPVCHKEFNENSDVVVCPECGTPHHRDCYNELGHCVNEGEHRNGFVWVSPIPEEVPTPEPHSKNEARPIMGMYDSDGNRFYKRSENGEIPTIEIDKNGATRPVYRPIDANEKIGEFSVHEFGEVIGENKQKYIPKFLIMEKTNRKVSWNWAALFFPAFWMLYRKMYNYGIIVLLITSIIPLVFMGKIVNYEKDYMAVVEEYSAGYSVNDEKANQEIADKLPDIPKSVSITSYISTAVQILAALFGNYLYKRHCERILKDAKSETTDVNSFESVLHKRGGRNPASLLIAIVAVYAINLLVAWIYTKYGVDLATLIWRLFK